jgi:hypothetical protein
MSTVPNVSVPDVFNQAFLLPEPQRAELAYQLLASLGDAPPAVEDDIPLEDLVAQRQEMLRRGECEIIEWREAMESLVAERVEMIARGECELEVQRDTLNHIDRALAEERRKP